MAVRLASGTMARPIPSLHRKNLQNLTKIHKELKECNNEFIFKMPHKKLKEKNLSFTLALIKTSDLAWIQTV